LALNFNPWAKFQTFRHLTPQLILGQFQHWIQLFIIVPMFSNCLLLISFLLSHAPWSLTLDCKYMYTTLLMLLAETQCGRL